MDRRKFLQSLTAIAGTLTLDPERLLWVPDHKTIFIAPPSYKPIELGSGAEDFIYYGMGRQGTKMGDVYEHPFRGGTVKYVCVNERGGFVRV